MTLNEFNIQNYSQFPDYFWVGPADPADPDEPSLVQFPKHYWFRGRIDYGMGWNLLTARTDLVVVNNGAMNADRYIRNILKEHVVPFAPYIGENFIFMDDNARPHRARIVQEYLEEVEVSRMEWPARSPDLNPIEQVWDNLNRRLRSSENHLLLMTKESNSEKSGKN